MESGFWNILFQFAIFSVILLIGGFLFAKYENRQKTIKKTIEKYNLLLKNLATQQNYLLGSDYEFALSYITANYHSVSEEISDNHESIIIGFKHDKYGRQMLFRWTFVKKRCTNLHIVANPDVIKDFIMLEQATGLKYKFDLHGGETWFKAETKTEYFLDTDLIHEIRDEWILQLLKCESINYRKDLSQLQKEHKHLLKD